MSSVTLAVIVELILLAIVNTENPQNREFYQTDLIQLLKFIPCTSKSAELESCLHNTQIGQKQYITDKQFKDYERNGSPLFIGDKTDIKRGRGGFQQCGCRVKIEHIDLGTEFFPRFVKNLTCEHSSMFPFKAKCLPIHYQVMVLTARTTPYDRTENEDQDYYKLPNELRRCWKYATVDVVSGCMCG